MLNPKVLVIGLLALSLGACSPEKQAEKSSVKQEVQKEEAVEQQPKVSFEQLYTDWRSEQISAKKYESEKNCTIEITLADDYKGPGIGLPLAAELEGKIIKGDLNADGQEDAALNVPYIQCDGGSALRYASISLFFVSQTDGSYQIVEDPKVLAKLANILKIKALRSGEVDIECFYHRDEAMMGYAPDSSLVKTLSFQDLI
ncbi:hypothetical protein SapgrDRAFT_2549 [Saprospira grandis DSM 2844]|uniref:Lipoprotein n=1 Tax=Saprospira grandis DSM 2844 TaxID=694433 RepID=J1I719_9BACT|nr:hypothetical protein [Saprospira grandis]EJF54208.1 hypothetical protein SapgrDRAFT_2549 [Saprospira grandis DSM 2844]